MCVSVVLSVHLSPVFVEWSVSLTVLVLAESLSHCTRETWRTHPAASRSRPQVSRPGTHGSWAGLTLQGLPGFRSVEGRRYRDLAVPATSPGSFPPPAPAPPGLLHPRWNRPFNRTGGLSPKAFTPLFLVCC